MWAVSARLNSEPNELRYAKQASALWRFVSVERFTGGGGWGNNVLVTRVGGRGKNSKSNAVRRKLIWKAGGAGTYRTLQPVWLSSRPCAHCCRGPGALPCVRAVCTGVRAARVTNPCTRTCWGAACSALSVS